MSNYQAKLWDISHISKNIKILFLSADFNREYTAAQEDISEKFLKEYGFTNIEKILVPGAFEIPGMLVRCLEADKYDLIYTFGVIIRGATDHYTFVAQETARGIMDATMNYDTPVVFGILTCENIQQVEERINSHLAVSGLNLLSSYKKL